MDSGVSGPASRSSSESAPPPPLAATAAAPQPRVVRRPRPPARAQPYERRPGFSGSGAMTFSKPGAPATFASAGAPWGSHAIVCAPQKPADGAAPARQAWAFPASVRNPPTVPYSEDDAAENRSVAGSDVTLRSTSDSLFTASSLSRGSEPATEERRLEQRQKQVDYGKNTIGYDRYVRLVPKHRRRKGDPMTPDRNLRCSKRCWDGLVRAWRRALHAYDPTPADLSGTAPLPPAGESAPPAPLCFAPIGSPTRPPEFQPASLAASAFASPPPPAPGASTAAAPGTSTPARLFEAPGTPQAASACSTPSTGRHSAFNPVVGHERASMSPNAAVPCLPWWQLPKRDFANFSEA